MVYPRSLARSGLVAMVFGGLGLLHCSPIPDYFDGYTCKDPDEDHLDKNGKPDPCHRRDEEAETCDGACIAPPPLGAWSGPALLWFGPKAKTPACPEWAPRTGYLGHDELTWDPASCLACECSPPSGSCTLPTVMMASTKACNIPGGTKTSFDAPVEWQGECTVAHAVSSTVQSLSIEAPAMKEEGCMPVLGPLSPAPQAPPALDPWWKVSALACLRDKLGTCPSAGDECAPKLAPEFRHCIFHEGDSACPAAPSPYVDRFVFYGKYIDERTCSPCACGAPVGSECQASVSVYKDFFCSEAGRIVTLAISSKYPAPCFSVPGGPLLSKSASNPVYHPGACSPSGGQPMGLARAEEPSTFCCLP